MEGTLLWVGRANVSPQIKNLLTDVCVLHGSLRLLLIFADASWSQQRTEQKMAAKNTAPVFPSPFKFGFFAGLGFFCASFLMSTVGFLFIVVCGVGITGAIGSAIMHSATSSQDTQPKTTRWAPPAAAVQAEPTEQR
jgi:hypothetical protein